MLLENLGYVSLNRYYLRIRENKSQILILNPSRHPLPALFNVFVEQIPSLVLFDFDRFKQRFEVTRAEALSLN